MSVQHVDWNAVADGATARVAAWIATLADEPANPILASRVGSDVQAAVRSDLLEGSRRDDDGFAFTRRLLDAVVGASDPFGAALELRKMSRELPASMPAVERLAVRASGIASLGLPWAVLPVARKWLRGRVSHLVLSTKPPGEGRELVLALSGEGVLGDSGAARELDRLLALAATPKVTTIALDVARLVPQTLTGAWSLDRDAVLGAERLRTLLQAAQLHDVSILFEAHDYRSALLAPQMLATALRSPGTERARVGVSLAAELPEALQTAKAMATLARERFSAGGAPIEVVVGVAGIAGREQIESILSGLAVAPLEARADREAQQLRVLVPLLEAGDAVRTVIASEDAHLLAAATVLAEQCGDGAPTLQLRAGVAPQLEAVAAEHGYRVRRRQPLVDPKEFVGAIEYLIALAAETADADSALAHTRALLAGSAEELAIGARHLREVVAKAALPAPQSHRVQQRAREWSEDARDTAVFYRAPTEPHRFETGGLTAQVLGLTRAHTGAITLEVAGAPLRVPAISASGFANEPDTDATRYANRAWVREAIAKAGSSDIGACAVAEAVNRGEDPAASIATLLAAGEAWRALNASERGARVARLALGAAAARDRLTEVLVAESGAPVPVIDTQINGVIDAARYLGQRAGGLGAIRGAQFCPDQVALVVAEAGIPLGERAEALLALLAAGSTVVLVADPSVARSSAVLIEEWVAAGLNPELVSLTVAAVSDDPRTAHFELAARVAADPNIDRAIVLGRRDTAKALLRRRPDLRIEGSFRTLGAVAIAPSADPVLAVRHAVASAFGAMHADHTTARALVLLGAAARSSRVHTALADAVASLRVGDTARPDELDPLSVACGPLPEIPDERGLRALTELDPGESWLVQPKRLDEEGLLWQPGVRTGLTKHSRFWCDAVGMPVIGVIGAHSIDEMITLTNELCGGGVAGLHAGDPAETLPWLERTRAARIVVGRATTGGRVERQPAGGWHAAGMGGSALTGGPYRLHAFGSWQLRAGTASATLHLRGLTPEVRLLIEAAQASLDYQSFDRVRRAALGDALAWRTSLGRARDESGLGIERNLLRHWPVAAHVRLAEGAKLSDLVRVVAAGLAVGAQMTVSTGFVLPPQISEVLTLQGVPVALERDDDWLARISVRGYGDDEFAAPRIRLIGGDRVRCAEWLGGLDEVSLWAEPVTMAGPVELLAFVREQAVSIAAHRHGLALLPAGVGGWIAELQGRG